MTDRLRSPVSTRTRLVVASIGFSTILTVAVLALVYVTANRTIAEETRSVVNAELTGLEDDYRRLGLLGLISAIERRLTDASERDALYLLTDARGKVLAGNLTRWPPDVIPGSGWVELDLVRNETSQTVAISAASLKLRRGERLLVGRDASARRQFDRVLLQSVGLALIAALAFSLLTGWLLTRLVFARLDAIARTADQIVAGDLTRRAPHQGSGDELDRMAAALNDMLDRTEQMVSNLRVTTNSIAHDLRSPLSRLRQRVEALTETDQSLEVRQSDAARAVAEIDRLLRILSQLTEISRAEAGLGREEFELVQIGDLIRDIAEFYEPVAEDQGVTLVWPDCEATLPGHRALLSQAVSNLLENALRYAPQGSRIELSAAETGGVFRLSVRDHGPGVPEEKLPEISKPFVTLDPSRTDQSSGLGLALVAAIARMHGGRFRALNRDPGFEAILDLPHSR